MNQATTLIELRREAITLKEKNFHMSYEDVRYFLEFDREPLTEIEWDDITFELDMLEEHMAAKYDAYAN